MKIFFKIIGYLSFFRGLAVVGFSTGACPALSVFWFWLSLNLKVASVWEESSPLEIVTYSPHTRGCGSDVSSGELDQPVSHLKPMHAAWTPCATTAQAWSFPGRIHVSHSEQVCKVPQQPSGKRNTQTPKPTFHLQMLQTLCLI